MHLLNLRELIDFEELKRSYLGLPAEMMEASEADDNYYCILRTLQCRDGTLGECGGYTEAQAVLSSMTEAKRILNDISKAKRGNISSCGTMCRVRLNHADFYDFEIVTVPQKRNHWTDIFGKEYDV